MVTVITGPINSGKTTRIQEIYKNLKSGDGFASIKNMNGSQVEGFDLMRLSTGETKPFIRRWDEKPDGWKENCTLGPYTVSDTAVKWVNREIDKLAKSDIEAILIDEAGVLEINGKCFFKVIKTILDSGKDIFITVRDKNKNAVIEHFGIADANIIVTGERYA